VLLISVWRGGFIGSWAAQAAILGGESEDQPDRMALIRRRCVLQRSEIHLGSAVLTSCTSLYAACWRDEKAAKPCAVLNIRRMLDIDSIQPKVTYAAYRGRSGGKVLLLVTNTGGVAQGGGQLEICLRRQNVHNAIHYSDLEYQACAVSRYQLTNDQAHCDSALL